MTASRSAAVLATASVAALALATCHDPTAPSDLEQLEKRITARTPDSAAILLRASNSGFPGRTHVVVVDSVTWHSLWAQALRGLQPAPPAPPVDFSTNWVVGIAVGSFPQSFSIRLDSLVTHEHGTVAYSTQSVPGETCIVPAIVTSPVTFVRAPGKPSIYFWVDRQHVYQCN